MRKMNLLLTGAGFTKNFGGYLASEMWNKIFNQIDSNTYPILKEKALEFSDAMDFEGLYNSVVDGDLPESDIQELSRIVSATYIHLDEAVTRWISNSDSKYPISSSKLSGFLNQFANWFTTNQDLFVERRLTSNFHCPNVGDDRIFRQRLGPAGGNINLVLPDDESTTPFPAERNYFKLHGSFNWRTSESEEILVIGSSKETQISRNPTLNQFFEKYKELLLTTGNQLLVIGYSFQDEHINEVILDAIADFGLRLSVMQPGDITLINNDEIKRNLECFFPYSIVDIFPLSGGEGARRELKDLLHLDGYVV